MKKNYGFIAPARDDRNFVFGDGQLEDVVLRPDGQWADCLPLFEAQSHNGFDTMNCWNFSTQKCLKTLLIEKGYEGKDIDYSERYICVLAGGTPNGGSPANACDAIRHYGVIPDSMLPFSANINSFWEFDSPRPMQQKYIDAGKKWLNAYDYSYDFVKTSYGIWLWKFVKGIISGKNQLSGMQQNMIKDALRYSPLGVSVCAWKFRNGLAYKNSWDRDNHWIELYGYVDGQYWLLYDNYSDSLIKAEWNYPFGFIMRYSVKKKNDMLKTIKKKDEAEIYVVASDNTRIMQIKAFESYQDMLSFGLIAPYIEVDDVSNYTIIDSAIGIII
jgi:hypothetical protein